MSHPYKAHKATTVAKQRVKAIMKKRGGAVEGDKEALHAAKKIVKHEEKELKVEGKKRGGRLDKYARGGKVGKKPHTQVNIAVVAPHGRSSPGDHGAAPAGGPPSPGGPPMPPPGMGAPPPGGPPMPPPGAMPPPGGKPPGMMNRGGRIKAGAESGEGRLEKSKMAKRRHSRG